MKLDRSRPFGEVFGGTGPGKYEQDGVMFDNDGNAVSIGESAPVAETAAVAPVRKKRGSKTAE